MFKTDRRNILKFALASPFVMTAAPLFAEQAWPSRPVQIMLGFAAGGAGDVACRLVFNRVSEILGKSMIIENRSGGASVFAAQGVLAAPKDGHAFFFNGSQQLIVPAILKDVPINFAAAFAPVTQLCTYPQVFAVAHDSPFQRIQDVVAYGKENPGKIRCGTSASGGMAHLAMEEFRRRADLKLIRVPYRAAAEGPRDLVSGELDLLVLAIPALTPMLQANRIRALAVSSLNPAKALPGVPTMASVGFPGFDMDDWGAIYAAVETPPSIINRMQSAIAEALADTTVSEKLNAVGAQPVGSKPEELAQFLVRQREVLTRVIQEANVALN
jgi:tripartite-type tricarboxylate transporter receptor subunit TctC